MKIHLLIISLLLLACTKKDDSLSLSAEQKDKQAKILINSIESLINEPDLKTMHDKARALEESRVIECSPLGDECNLHHELLNKIVKLTSDQEFSDQDKKEIDSDLQNLKAEILKNRPVKK